ncbi:MAG: hypothetical protein A2901_03780 [Elusimicrobia bacterium RIFCSPLOWO2_01_FULL_54_10]|nr:MAG: hypothetical protein A2901_03780 [Elusimicrobia bacterium RIFCSPLOWO2_01_FULL_54_10]
MKKSVSHRDHVSPQRHEESEEIPRVFEIEDLEMKEERIDMELYEYMVPAVNGGEVIYPYSDWQTSMDDDED